MSARSEVSKFNKVVANPQWPHLVALAVIFGVEIFVRIMAAYHFSNGNLATLIYSDEKGYYLPAAQAILNQGLAFFLTPRSLWNGPVNPLWIALWQCYVPAVKIANILFISVCSVCIWDISRRLFGYAAAYLTLFLFILYPPLLEFGSTVLTEPPFVCLIVLSFWLYTCAPLDRRLCAVLAGVLLGFAILTRPTLQLFPVFLCVVVLVLQYKCRRKNFEGSNENFGQRNLFIFAVAAFLTVVPYNIKNFISFGKIGVANGFGAVFFLGNDLRTSGDEPIYSQMSFDTSKITTPFTHLDSEGDRALTAAAVRNIVAEPTAIFLLTLRKPFKYLFGHPIHYFYPYYDVISFGRNASRTETIKRTFEVIATCFAVIFGLVGLIFLPFRKDLHILFATFVLYMVALHSVAFAIPRLALPIFPIWAVLASASLVVSVRDRRWRIFVPTLMLFLGASLYVLFGARNTNPHLVQASTMKGFPQQKEVLLNSPKSLHEIRMEGEDFVSTGRDPFVELNFDPVATILNQVVFVELKARGPSSTSSKQLPLQLFWAQNSDQAFEEGRSLAIPVLSDGEFHWYRLSPSSNPGWSGPLGAFRLDFADNARGARYQVRRMVMAN